MPAEVRDRFQNDPGRFLEFANDASNYDEALKMGLAIKRPEKAAVGPGSGLPEPSVDLGSLRPGGAMVAPEYKEAYYRNLFYMERDYMQQIPAKYLLQKRFSEIGRNNETSPGELKLY